MARSHAPGSAPRVIATVVLGVEALALAVAALAYVTLAVVGGGQSREFLIAMAAMAALSAVGLGFATRGVARSRRWALAPSITWQVLQGFVGAYIIPSDMVVFGLSLLIPAVVGGLALIATARSQAASSG